MTADTQDVPRPDSRPYEYTTADGQIWTYVDQGVDAFLTRGPGGKGGGYALWWVIDRYGPITPVLVHDEVARLRQELAEANDARLAAAEAYNRRATKLLADRDKVEAERDSLAARLADAEKVVEAAKAYCELYGPIKEEFTAEEKRQRWLALLDAERNLALAAMPSTSDVQVLGDQVLVDQPKEGDRG
jgi:hypothetical protein